MTGTRSNLWLFILVIAALSSLQPRGASAFAGSGMIVAMKGGDFLVRYFGGTVGGRDSAYTYCGANGIVSLGPGTEGLGFGTVPIGVIALRQSYQGWELAGRPMRILPGGTLRMVVDSTGAAITGKAVISDSARVNGPLDVSGGKGHIADSLRADKGIQIGGQLIKKHLSASAGLDFNLSSVPCEDLTITVAGAAVGDVVSIGAPWDSITPDTFYWAFVSAVNTVTVRACRLSGTPNPTVSVFRVDVWQH